MAGSWYQVTVTGAVWAFAAWKGNLCQPHSHLPVFFPHSLPRVRPTQSTVQLYCTKKGPSKQGLSQQDCPCPCGTPTEGYRGPWEMPLCIDVEGDDELRRSLPPCRSEEKGTKWVLRMACGWVPLCAVSSLHLPALGIPSMVSSNCQDPGIEGGWWMVPNHRSRSRSCRKEASVPPMSAFGPCWHRGRSTLGPLYCRWGFLDRKFELLMNVGSVQQKFNSTSH